MGKLLIDSQTLKDLKEHPDQFTKETIKLYNKAKKETEQSDEYTLIGVDLAKETDSDYSVYTKMWFKDGKFTVLESSNSKGFIKTEILIE